MSSFLVPLVQFTAFWRQSETIIIFGVTEATKYKATVFVWGDIDLATNKNGPSYSPEEQLGELNWTLNSEQAFPTSSEMSYSQNKWFNGRYRRAWSSYCLRNHRDAQQHQWQTDADNDAEHQLKVKTSVN